MKYMRIFMLAVICLVVVSCSKGTDQAPADVNNGADTTAVAGRTKASARTNIDGIDTVTFHVTDSTVTLRATGFPQPTGRVVNVMVTGVDSRLGDPMGHADANHLIRFFIDSGCVEIISIPRDTYFDAGFDDTTNLNKLTNVRANRGRTSYLKAICEIAGVPRIDYWVEFGFSQAIGLLELMGYKENASSTLRVLRSRQAYSSGDFQRVYNQGQFMRQVMLRAFDNTDDFVGELGLRAALALVETNMTYDACEQILDDLRSHGFSSEDPTRIWVRLKPSLITKLKVYSFDSANVTEINKQISQKIGRMGLDSIPINQETYERRLAKLIDKAALDSARSPASVIRLLRRPYEQRAWLQVPDLSKRKAYRDRMCSMLIVSYRRVKNHDAAHRIEDYISLDNKVNASK
ncbi:MAG: LCP family protein [Ignavibacteria bacterium]|nr:LCP family protein [Ignavibacteria bacterium]